MKFVKLAKNIVEWEWFTDGNMLKVWIYLLAKAQQFEGTRYKGIELKTGQLVTGRQKIAAETNLSEREVRTCLNRLKSTNEITIESTNKYSIITIVKYDYYQSNEPYYDQQSVQQLDQQATSKRPASDQQATTSKTLRHKDYVDSSKKEEITKEEKAKKIDLSGYSDRFVETYNEFMDMRKRKKNPNTLRSQELILKQLFKISNDEDVQIQSMEQSIRSGWLDVYPPKEDTRPKQQATGLEALMQI